MAPRIINSISKGWPQDVKIVAGKESCFLTILLCKQLLVGESGKTTSLCFAYTLMFDAFVIRNL